MSSTVEPYKHNEYSSSNILILVKLDDCDVEVLLVMQMRNIIKTKVRKFQAQSKHTMTLNTPQASYPVSAKLMNDRSKYYWSCTFKTYPKIL